MKTTILILITATTFVVLACKSTKKSSKTANTAPVVAITTTPTASVTNSYRIAKSRDGVHEPGNEELFAIQAQYKETSLEKLKEGYAIYKSGECVQCHNAKSIYSRGVTEWKSIVDDMAQRAQISDSKKDAVYKYVLSIKSSQP